MSDPHRGVGTVPPTEPGERDGLTLFALVVLLAMCTTVAALLVLAASMPR